jgi:hypothetical protein
LHSKLGSGHLPHGGHGAHESVLLLIHGTGEGHAGHTGGTISDFNIYKSSSPGGILLDGIPGGKSFE